MMSYPRDRKIMNSSMRWTKRSQGIPVAQFQVWRSIWEIGNAKK